MSPMWIAISVVLSEVLTQLWTPSFVPHFIQTIMPSIGWLTTEIVCASVSYKAAGFLLLFLACVVGLVLFLAKWRVSFPIVRLLILPFFISSVWAILVQVHALSVIPSQHPLIVICVALLQVWGIISAITLLCCFPSTALTMFSSQSEKEQKYLSNAQSLRNCQLQVERLPVSNGVGITLDTFHVSPLKETPKWVFYQKGNGEFIETSLEHIGLLAKELEAHVILFNPRGSGTSSGYPVYVHQFVEDATAVAHFYEKRFSINPAFLLFLGHSIGGGIAGELIHTFSRSPLVIDRSFSSLSDAVASKLPIYSCISKRMCQLLVGDLNTFEGWKSVDQHRKLIIYAESDPIIDFTTASIMRKISDPNQENIIKIENLSCFLEENVHNISFQDLPQRNRIKEALLALFPKPEEPQCGSQREVFKSYSLV